MSGTANAHSRTLPLPDRGWQPAAVGDAWQSAGVTEIGVPFTDLKTADLRLEHTYLGGTAGNAGDDPLAVLVRVGNQGGFRYVGSPAKETVRLVVLYTSGVNPDWPDVLDPAT